MAPQQNKRMITLSRGGSEERRVALDDVYIPDMWHLAMAIKGDRIRRLSKAEREQLCEMVLECWHRAHDLKKEFQRAME